MQTKSLELKKARDKKFRELFGKIYHMKNHVKTKRLKKKYEKLYALKLVEYFYTNKN